ncbi:hypothetical protein [Rubellimicrobium thermophilum]|uniref:hypothetical protein n=1 Tax=Rubellimicrobium thermophilum TaxID=295419 RepID=UPI0003FA1EA1|nr:hypothetical protein [Rubellimicrobium thermophilum]
MDNLVSLFADRFALLPPGQQALVAAALLLEASLILSALPMRPDRRRRTRQPLRPPFFEAG